MSTAAPQRPTLWRTCRTLANTTRLEMLRYLFEQPGRTVSAVAIHLRQPLSLTSEYLRALEARGLLTAQRSGRWVTYHLIPATGPNEMSGLVAALRATFQREPKAIAHGFRLTTAFTHPRRVEIFRILQAGPSSLEQLQATTHIPTRALLRDLRKLEARDYARWRGALCETVQHPSALGRELARLAGLSHWRAHLEKCANGSRLSLLLRQSSPA